MCMTHFSVVVPLRQVFLKHHTVINELINLSLQFMICIKHVCSIFLPQLKHDSTTKLYRLRGFVHESTRLVFFYSPLPQYLEYRTKRTDNLHFRMRLVVKRCRCCVPIIVGVMIGNAARMKNGKRCTYLASRN